MNSVEVVKTICKQRKIPISKLEKDLGFSNGYIGQLKKGSLKNDRATLIADYLNVPAEYLSGHDFDDLISCEVQAAYKNNEKLFDAIPPDVMRSVLSGSYTFDSDNFHFFSEIIGKTLVEVISSSGNYGKPTSVSDEALKFALWGDTSSITDADLEDVRRFAAFIKQKREQEGGK